MKGFIEKLKSKAKTLVDKYNSEYYTAVELSDAIEFCKKSYEQGIKDSIKTCEDFLGDEKKCEDVLAIRFKTKLDFIGIVLRVLIPQQLRQKLGE